VVFLILRFIKNEFVWFKDKYGAYAFSIKIDGPQREEAKKLVEDIRLRIRERKVNQ
jgi:hypothetical protein